MVGWVHCVWAYGEAEHLRRAWQSKSAHLMAAQKQRVGSGQGKDGPLKDITSDVLSAKRLIF